MSFRNLKLWNHHNHMLFATQRIAIPQEAANLLLRISFEDTIALPPVKPKAGDVFIFSNKDSKDDWKSDQYRWANNGIIKVLTQCIGDENTISEDFPHGKQKKHTERMYCKQCPSSLKLIAEKVSHTDPAKLNKS